LETNTLFKNTVQVGSKDVRVSIGILQLGGDVSQISNVFNVEANQEQRSAFVECTLGTFDKCSFVLDQALAYATGSSDSAFPKQLERFTQAGAAANDLPVGLAVMRYLTKPYPELITLTPKPPVIGGALKAARDRVIDEFERQLTFSITAERFLNARRLLSARQEQTMRRVFSSSDNHAVS
jgi:hypothetical protein